MGPVRHAGASAARQAGVFVVSGSGANAARQVLLHSFSVVGSCWQAGVFVVSGSGANAARQALQQSGRHSWCEHAKTDGCVALRACLFVRLKLSSQS